MSNRESLDLQAALRDMESSRTAPERSPERRFSRFPARGEIGLQAGNTNTLNSVFLQAHVRDISRGGIGVLCNESVALGSHWRIHMSTGPVALCTVPGFCRFCRDVVPGTYLLGLEFGMNAGLLMALGVPAIEIANGDERGIDQDMSAEIVDPSTVLDDEAA